jgi:hypothetical protein
MGPAQEPQRKTSRQAPYAVWSQHRRWVALKTHSADTGGMVRRGTCPQDCDSTPRHEPKKPEHWHTKHGPRRAPAARRRSRRPGYIARQIAEVASTHRNGTRLFRAKYVPTARACIRRRRSTQTVCQGLDLVAKARRRKRCWAVSPKQPSGSNCWYSCANCWYLARQYGIRCLAERRVCASCTCTTSTRTTTTVCESFKATTTTTTLVLLGRADALKGSHCSRPRTHTCIHANA